MRRFIILFIICTLCLSLFACNKEKTPEPTENLTNTSTVGDETSETESEATEETTEETTEEDKRLPWTLSSDGKIILPQKTVKSITVTQSGRVESIPIGGGMFKLVPRDFDEVTYRSDKKIPPIMNAIENLTLKYPRPHLTDPSPSVQSVKIEYEDGYYSLLDFSYQRGFVLFSIDGAAAVDRHEYYAKSGGEEFIAALNFEIRDKAPRPTNPPETEE
jgi:hypothetical protein